MNHSWISCRCANSIILNYSSVYFSKARTLSCMIIVQSSKSLFYISISSTDSFAFNQLTQRCHFFLSSLGYNSVSYVAFNTQVSIGSLDLNWFFKFSSIYQNSEWKECWLFILWGGPLWICLLSSHDQTQAMHSWQESCRNDAMHWEAVSSLATGDVSLYHLVSHHKVSTIPS